MRGAGVAVGTGVGDGKGVGVAFWQARSSTSSATPINIALIMGPPLDIASLQALGVSEWGKTQRLKRGYI
ncbi:MAG: hypothetical protein HYU29_07820 [Chloroflexi bacterium]|nr:hypothetical protein [Chloroflexota bacterium]